METTPTTGKEAADFVKACQAIAALLACEPLTPADRDLIVITANELLIRLKA